MIDTNEEQYLVQEPQSEYKSEFRDGRAVATSGASFVHNRIATNMLIELGRQLREKPCDVVGGDMRVKVATAHFYTYPDVSVVCGKPEFDARDKDALLNPIVIVEVLSESTEAYDRGEKFEYFKQLDSLREYVLVSQEKPRVECFLRQESGAWKESILTKPTELVTFPSLACVVALGDIYHKVEFEA